MCPDVCNARIVWLDVPNNDCVCLMLSNFVAACSVLWILNAKVLFAEVFLKHLFHNPMEIDVLSEQGKHLPWIIFKLRRLPSKSFLILFRGGIRPPTLYLVQA